jgi:hypothetical protein
MAIDWYAMPKGYEARYTPCADGVYWHLYRGAERVNGGISYDHGDAQMCAAHYARRHGGDDLPGSFGRMILQEAE